MRVYFKQQLELGITPIHEVELNFKSRHSLMPLLRGLQYAYETAEVNQELFKILEARILGDKKKTGCYGMSLWEILVLGTVKANLNIDYDELHDLTNEHASNRGVLGIQRSDFRDGKTYSLQTIKDNVRLLDEETIQKIVYVIANAAHDIVKKKEGKASLNLVVKADSFVVESNIHFPTDLNLLWDSVRKSIETIGFFRQQGIVLSSWREWKYWRREVRSAYRLASEIHRKKGAKYEARLKSAVEKYLLICKEVNTKVLIALRELTVKEQLIKDLTKAQGAKLVSLRHYQLMLAKHIDLVNRRIILGEKIPHSEKVFSIFETHVEWNSKGKANKSVELGHNVLVATCQYGFIVYSEVYDHQVDKERTIEIGKEIAKSYGTKNKLTGISFDRNFFSGPAEKILTEKYEIVVLPKSGRPSKLELEMSENEDYKKVKKGHSQIEGNINELEHHGLDLCRDKGMDGFKRHVAYGVLSYNLTKLGRMLVSAKVIEMKRAKKRKNKQIASF